MNKIKQTKLLVRFPSVGGLFWSSINVFKFVLVPACKAKIFQEITQRYIVKERINPLFINCKAFGHNEVRDGEWKVLTCPEDGDYFVERSTKFSVIYFKKGEKIAGLWEKETSYPEDRGSPTVTAMSSWVNLSKLTSVQPCTWAGYLHKIFTSHTWKPLSFSSATTIKPPEKQHTYNYKIPQDENIINLVLTLFTSR